VAALLVASFSAAQLICSPLLGRLSDRIGRKPVLIFSLVGTAIGSLLTGLAGSIAILFAGRVIDGASGASVSVAQASVGDVASPADRARLFGLLGAAFGLGFVAGPAMGALFAIVNPKLPFLVAAGLAAVNAAVAVRRLPETNPRHQRGEHPHLGDEIGAARDNSVVRLIVLAFFALASFSAFEATFSLFGEQRLGFRLASTGAVFAAIGVLIAIVQGGLVHPVVKRLGEEGTLRAGLALNAVGLVLLALVHHWWQLVPALIALTVGQGLASPALTSAVSNRVDQRSRGRVLGLQQSAGGLARVVGPALGGLAFQRIGIASPYLIGAAVMAACAAFVSTTRRSIGLGHPAR
jgi:DHA1 family tetracycline resistance protein-like MFS transporter